MKEQDVLKTARIAFRETTGGVFDVLEDKRNLIQPFDVLIQLKLRQHQEVLLAEVKNELRKQDVPQILEQFRLVITGYNNEKIILAQYIPGPVKEDLRKNHINYLEATGNCFIQMEHLFLFVNDRKAAPVRKTADRKLWNKTGLKYVYTFLVDPEMLWLPMREQATRAGIALGNLTGLKEELNQLTKGLNVQYGDANWLNILQRWGLQYQHALKPVLNLGAYRFLKSEMKEDWKNLKVPKKTWWGGENAGALITKYLRPKDFTVYTRNKVQLIADWKLVPDENGEINLYEPFWPIETDNQKMKHVDPIIAWADLNFELDQRLRETAERILINIKGEPIYA